MKINVANVRDCRKHSRIIRQTEWQISAALGGCARSPLSSNRFYRVENAPVQG